MKTIKIIIFVLYLIYAWWGCKVVNHEPNQMTKTTSFLLGCVVSSAFVLLITEV